MNATIDVRAPSEQSEGTRSQVQRWLKAVGEAVAENEPLIEVETDKVTIEIPSPASGVLQEIIKQEAEEIQPGDLLGRIEAQAQTPAATRGNDTAASATAKPAPAQASDNVRVAALSAYADIASAGRSSPAVRRLLEERGLRASDVSGTGAGGRITVDDVLAHASGHASSGREVEQLREANVTARGSERRVAHSATRKRIAERMVQSLLHTAPHVTTVFEADMSAVLDHRARHRADFEHRGASLTLTAYFISACVDAIRAVPEANSRWTDDALFLSDTIDIGVGTAIENKGLVVPVVRNVHSLDLFAIAQRLDDLVRRARKDELTPADVRGGTFTISNHGVSGSLVAAPIIINQPQSAILGVGKLEKRAVVVNEDGTDTIVIRPRCFITLTIDHRVMDGHRANRFLEVFVDRLEDWSD
jgi:2-oxoglutarate dehydrogenase E2 component (dihydrolipoamide succinyltransferase)